MTDSSATFALGVHAERHGRTGADQITPEAVEALNAASFGLVGDGKAFGAGAMTASSAVLTDTANAPFTANDVGKLIAVLGAGASAGLNLWTTIASYGPAQDGSQVTLTVPAGQSVTGHIYNYGTDDTAAWTAWVNAINTHVSGRAQGLIAFAPRCISFVTSALPQITVAVNIRGTGAASSFGAPGTVINFAPGVPGLKLGTGTSYSVVEGIYFRSQSALTAAGTTENGITCLGARVQFRNVIADGFGQDGFNFDTTGGGNTDLCSVDSGCLATNNGRDGYHIVGPNSNIIGLSRCSALANTRWGFHNEGTGTVLLNTHTAGNNTGGSGGAYYDNAASGVYINPYSEHDGAQSAFFDTNSELGYLIVGAQGPSLSWVSAAVQATWYVWQNGSALAGCANRLGAKTFTANGTYTIPAGATQLKITAVGGGGQGGGAGSAAAAQLQAGAGGGGAGGSASAVVAVGSNTTLAVTVGAGGSGSGAGGALGGNPGATGGTGHVSSVVGTGIGVYVPGGVGGGASAASSVTTVGGGFPAGAPIGAPITVAVPGQGGTSGIRSTGPAGLAGPGGGGGGAATATNGGSGGATAITTGNGTCAPGSSGGSGTSAGGNGVDAPANSGQGGGGGGGGAAGTGAGGNGGAGGSGVVIIEVLG